MQMNSLKADEHNCSISPKNKYKSPIKVRYQPETREPQSPQTVDLFIITNPTLLKSIETDNLTEGSY